MTTLAAMVSRVRVEIGDQAQSFVWQTTATATNRYQMPYAPVDALSAVVKVNGIDVSLTSTIEETTGVLILNTVPAAGSVIIVTGTHFRFFTDAELSDIVNAAALEHMHNRTDAFNRPLTLSNLDPVEEYPLAILGSIQALYTLATDASFDIDISTPDGVSVPRSERYRQLMEMVQARQAQYMQLCEALNIGMYRIETFTFRRISKMTNRYVPIYRPQEVDDRSEPERVFLPIPTYGAQPVPDDAQVVNIVTTQGDAWAETYHIALDLTQYNIAAQARLFPESGSVAATFTVTPVDLVNGTFTLSLAPTDTQRLPLRCYWDLQLTSKSDPTNVRTYIRGSVFANREVTRP